MNSRNVITVLACVAGVLCLVIAAVYWVVQEKSLPSFFPGHNATGTGHHFKHGVAAFVVGLACFAFAWFYSGPKSSSPAT